MKKFLSIILAIVTMFSIGTMAFAHENVDNTFDNFTPGPGIQAPDNWYDPYCYDEDGCVKATCFAIEDGTYYCKQYKKIYTNQAQAIPNSNKYFCPYEIVDENSKYGVSEYCPYCGIISNLSIGVNTNNGQPDYTKTHTVINDVYFGKECENCGEYFASKYDNRRVTLGCGGCLMGNYDLSKLYRFIPKSYEDAEFAHIFNDSEHKFGDGKDGYLEDLGTNSFGYYVGWDNPADNPVPEEPEEPTELTFWQKIVQFFTNIGLWFASLFSF